MGFHPTPAPSGAPTRRAPRARPQAAGRPPDAPAAPGCRASPASAPPPITTAITCCTHFTNESHEGSASPSLGYQTTPCAAPTVLAVELDVAKDALHVEAHTWPVPAPGAAGDAGRPGSRPCNPHALCWKPPQRVRAVGGGPVGDHPAPAPPGAPRADRALTPTGPCGAPTSANRTRTWRLPHRRIPPRALAAPPGRASPGIAPHPAASHPVPRQPPQSLVVLTSSTNLGNGQCSNPVPQSLGCLPTPSAATASRTPSPSSPPAVRAMPATHALIAWLALPPIASLRHPRPAPHRPDPPGSSRATSHHPLVPTLTPRVPALPSFRSPQPC